MPRTRGWRDVLVGLLSIAAALAGAAAVLVFARVGALHGKTVAVHATTGNAAGLIPGSEVWLDGQKVGLVAAIDFRPPSADTSQRILLTLELLDEHARLLRRDAPLSIRSGGSLIGAPVVYMGTGSASAPPIADGDTLAAHPVRETEVIRGQLATAGSEVPAILANVRVLGTQLRATAGTLQAFGAETGPLAATTAAAERLLARATGGSGTVGLALQGGELAARARRMSAQSDTVRALLSSSRTSIGRLRADSALPRVVGQLRADLAAVTAALEEPRGTAGRLRRDERLVRELARARTEIEALFTDLRENPSRYVNF